MNTPADTAAGAEQLPARRTATFPGDCRDFDPDSYVGSMGRFYRPVAAEYDGTQTVITYEPVPMEEMGQRFGHHIDSAIERIEIAALFGGPR